MPFDYQSATPEVKDEINRQQQLLWIKLCENGELKDRLTFWRWSTICLAIMFAALAFVTILKLS